MSIKKDEAYFGQYINKIFTLPNGDTNYALVDVKKIGKTFYFIYIGVSSSYFKILFVHVYLLLGLAQWIHSITVERVPHCL
jgi:hypothetical protein